MDKGLEAARPGRPADYAFQLPRPLGAEEKKYLLSVERGDLPNVRRILLAAAAGSTVRPRGRILPGCLV